MTFKSLKPARNFLISSLPSGESKVSKKALALIPVGVIVTSMLLSGAPS
jgi:hypothetical protein